MPVIPDLNAASFVPGTAIDNPYFPLTERRILSYQVQETDPETGALVTTERNDLQTTDETFTVRGVETTVIRDSLYFEGEKIGEETLDWYAQDNDGNVWYFGEIVINYEYDEDGNFIGTNNDGQWSADDPGNEPGWMMKASPDFGPSYALEVAPGIAEDESIIIGRDLTVETPFSQFDDVTKIVDSSPLSPDSIEFKYYAGGVGEITEEEIEADGSIGSVSHLYRVTDLPPPHSTGGDDMEINLSDLAEGAALDNPGELAFLDIEDFAATGQPKQVTYLGGMTENADALGAYAFDPATGAIGEARILFPDLSITPLGTSIRVDVPSGQVLSLFLVRGSDAIGIDLSQYESGGLHLTNIATGAPATMGDGFAPIVTDDGGAILPVQPLSSFGADDGRNLLNPAGGIQTAVLETEVDGDVEFEVLGFEDWLVTSPKYDGDFNDAIVTVSDDVLDVATTEALLAEAGMQGNGTAEDDTLNCGETSDDFTGLSRNSLRNDPLAIGNGIDTTPLSEPDVLVL